jgi:hypothetical protein
VKGTSVPEKLKTMYHVCLKIFFNSPKLLDAVVDFLEKNPDRRIFLPINEIKQGNDILGEVDHPDQLNINLDRVSHVITKIWMDGSDAIGRLKILRTPAGAIIESLLKEGIKLGVSSRGTGNVDNNGNVSDFEIVTIDIVARPSAPDAYPKSVYEALNSKRGAIIEDLSKTVSNIKDDPKAQEHLARELINWINSLKA